VQCLGDTECVDGMMMLGQMFVRLLRHCWAVLQDARPRRALFRLDECEHGWRITCVVCVDDGEAISAQGWDVCPERSKMRMAQVMIKHID
jgi:hypothetical protein